MIEDNLAEEMLAGNIKPGDKITVDAEDENVIVKKHG
jgi:ATP-dependent Clp protease ATP-binding subunit ClpA